jgi:hypothetical protein
VIEEYKVLFHGENKRNTNTLSEIEIQEQSEKKSVKKTFTKARRKIALSARRALERDLSQQRLLTKSEANTNIPRNRAQCPKGVRARSLITKSKLSGYKINIYKR